jgi:hypothetical protein
MSVRSRLLTVLAVLVLALSASGLAIAQTGNPDPNAPVKERTPTPGGEKSTFPRPATPEATSPAGDETGNATPSESGTPSGAATPLASSGTIPLAAMTLDNTTIPSDFELAAERYTTLDDLVASLAGQVSPADLQATGLIDMYTSYYVNKDRNSVRSYIIAYKTVDGVQKGFDILENETLLVPNGAMTDTPAPAGLGESPSEITSGYTENGDGTQTHTYDISFRIDRYEVGAAMETFDGSQPDTAVVDQMARDVSKRVTAVLAGKDASGVDLSLPTKLLDLKGQVTIEGFETGSEAFILPSESDVPAGYVAGYFRGNSYSRSVTTPLPFVTLGVTTFETADDVATALENTDSLMPTYNDLKQITRFRVRGADDAVAFSYTSPNGTGQPDSVRIFAQVDDQLFVVDVQGMGSINDATTAAVDLAEAQIGCAAGGDCSDPGAVGS